MDGLLSGLLVGLGLLVHGPIAMSGIGAWLGGRSAEREMCRRALLQRRLAAESLDMESK